MLSTIKPMRPLQQPWTLPCYRLGGLSIHSDIPLPELTPLTIGSADSPDVQILSSAVPGKLTAADWQGYGVQVKGDTALLTIPKIGRFLIENGRTIHIDPEPTTDPADLRLFLLGTAFGILHYQRGAFPLHASAILANQQQAVAFVGDSGAGKSTLGAWLSRAGHPLLTDDVCIVESSNGAAPTAYSGLPRIKLW